MPRSASVPALAVLLQQQQQQQQQKQQQHHGAARKGVVGGEWSGSSSVTAGARECLGAKSLDTMLAAGARVVWWGVCLWCRSRACWLPSGLCLIL